MPARLLLDFLFPKRCVTCGTIGSYFCRSCLSQIKFVENLICPVCERSAIGGATHPGCRRRYTLDGLLSSCIYEGPIKAAVKRLKYKPWITDLGETLVDLSLFYPQKNPTDYLIKINPILVPVPLYPSRERERGFNQSEILGKLVAQKMKLRFVSNLLIRQKKTKPQAELKGKERLENIKNAFVINRDFQFMIHSSNILLIDDVWTTGSTLKSCGEVLKRAGFPKVWALTVAR